MKAKTNYLALTFFTSLLIFILHSLRSIKIENRQDLVISENIEKANYYKNTNEACNKVFTLEEVSEISKYSVVELNTMKGNGSAFVIKHDKNSTYLITNSHVVEKNAKVNLKWTDGSEDIAEVVYNGRNTNIFNDLALLKLPLKKGNPLKLELNKISVGRDVVAIGSPKGLGFTITRGIISAIRNDGKLIQTDAAINQGNSGGPLLDKSGCVIGINSFIFKESEGLNFAIASSLAENFFNEYKNSPRRSKLPKSIQDKNLERNNIYSKKYFPETNNEDLKILENSDFRKITCKSDLNVPDSFSEYLDYLNILKAEFKNINTEDKASEYLDISCALMNSRWLTYDSSIQLKRAQSSIFLDDKKAAFETLNNIINNSKLDRDKGEAYFLKGNIQFELNDIENACNNWKKSNSFGKLDAEDKYNKFCPF